jgi:hypothetical protein
VWHTTLTVYAAMSGPSMRTFPNQTAVLAAKLRVSQHVVAALLLRGDRDCAAF